MIRQIKTLWKLVSGEIKDVFDAMAINVTTKQIKTGSHEINSSVERGSVGEEYDLLLYLADASADQDTFAIKGATPTTQDYVEAWGGEDATGQWGKGFLLRHDKADKKIIWQRSESGKNDGTETDCFSIDESGNTVTEGVEKADGYIEAVATKTADYTATSSDSLIIADGTSNTVTITLPTAVGITGRVYKIKCIDDTFQVDVSADGTETIDGSLTKTLSQWDCLTVISDGSDWMVI